MRKLKYFSLLMAAGLFAACSDNLDVDSGNGNSNEYVGDKGYVNIGINLPTTPSTRVNDDFDDGEADEYKVNEVIIALFYDTKESSGESNATCQWAFKLDNTNFIPSGNSNDNITSYYASGVRMIPAPTNNVYALAIVNPINKFDVSNVSASSNAANENAGDAVLTTYLTVNNGSEAVRFEGKLSDLNTSIAMSAITDVTGDSYNDFMMTNAPIASSSSFTYTTNPSADFKVTTLAPIKVYNDKSLAEGASKDNPIYVERVVAKTQVKIGGNSVDGSLTVESDVTAYNGAEVEFKGWKLQNTNKKYYPVRKVTDTSIADWEDWSKLVPATGSKIANSKNRFFGNIADPYRTYWSIDPNYDTDSEGDYNVLTTEPAWNAVGYGNTASKIEYCLENTTTAKTMENDRLTNVILKGIFTPNDATQRADFFLINNTSAIYSTDQFLAVATAALTDDNALESEASLQLKTGLTSGADITTWQGVQDLLVITGGTSGKLTEQQATAILNSSAIGGSIKYYQGGVTYYYTTVIRHFNDDEAPLGSTSITTADNYVEADHLGRYGVLRNNWYELEVNKVTGPGEPVLPDDGGGTNPPDKTASYINCEINVLSWAKRSQSVEL